MFREEKMKGERAIDNNSHGETPRLTSNDYHHSHQQMLRGVSSASSCSSTTGFCFSDVGSSSMPLFDHSELSTPETHFVDQSLVGSNFQDSWYRGVNNGIMMDELGLSNKFHAMNVGNGTTEVSSDVGRLGRNPDAFRINDYNVSNIRASNGENFGYPEGFINGFPGNGGFHSSIGEYERNIKDEMNFILGQREVNLGNSLESIVPQNQSNSHYSGLGHRNCLINFPLEETPLQTQDYYGNFVPVMRGNNCYNDGILIPKTNNPLGNGAPIHRLNEHTGNGSLIQRAGDGYGNETPLHIQSMYGPHVVGDSLQQCMMEARREVLNPWGGCQNFPVYNAYPEEPLLQLQQCGGQFCGNMSGLNPMDSSQLIYSKQALYNSMRENMRAAEMKKVRQLKPCGNPMAIENAFFIKEKGRSSGAIGKSGQSSSRAKNSLTGSAMQKLGDQLQLERTYEIGSQLIGCDPVFLYNSLVEVQGNMYLMAKDQHGCRFLQKKFDEGSFEDVQLIFNEIIDHAVELMMNPFGNYLIQKLLDVCNEEQRMRIIHVVTKDRGELVRISLNTHGTRVVQKLIESLKTRKQISSVVQALEPGFLDLIKDLNGNHVVQRCLQCLSNDENKFIYDAAAKSCVEIATHRHGCCVLQRCIAFSSGEQRKKLVDEISRNGLRLARDPYGNYVVQYIIELKIPSVSAKLMSLYEGLYVDMSTLKFSSHVVEKCLYYIEESQPRIVYELLSVSHFERLLQDPFANYVIQTALEVTKGALYESLVAAIRPHYAILRTNPFCKKLFSRGLLKK